MGGMPPKFWTLPHLALTLTLTETLTETDLGVLCRMLFSKIIFEKEPTAKRANYVEKPLLWFVLLFAWQKRFTLEETDGFEKLNES